MTNQTGAEFIDVREMVVVHTAMLRELRLLPAAIREVREGDTRRVSLLADHARFMLEMLHHHHASEDELLWPPLRAGASTPEIALIVEGESQHEDLAGDISASSQAVSQWRRSGTDADRDTAATALTRLHAGLDRHFDFEERRLLPLASTHLTLAQWAAFGEAGRRSVPGRSMPLVLGMFLYEGDPEVVRSMISGAPLPVRYLGPVLGRRAYAAHARKAYGTPTP